MAKEFGIATNTETGFSGVGTVTSFTKTTNATAVYARDSNNDPDASSTHKDPTTASAELELSGTAPTAGTTEITIGADVYHTTSAAQAETAGAYQTVSVELSEKITPA